MLCSDYLHSREAYLLHTIEYVYVATCSLLYTVYCLYFNCIRLWACVNMSVFVWLVKNTVKN